MQSNVHNGVENGVVCADLWRRLLISLTACNLQHTHNLCITYILHHFWQTCSCEPLLEMKMTIIQHLISSGASTHRCHVKPLDNIWSTRDTKYMHSSILLSNINNKTQLWSIHRTLQLHSTVTLSSSQCVYMHWVNLVYLAFLTCPLSD